MESRQTWKRVKHVAPRLCRMTENGGSVQVLVYASIMSMISKRIGKERLQAAALTHLIDSSSPRMQQTELYCTDQDTHVQRASATQHESSEVRR